MVAERLELVDLRLVDPFEVLEVPLALRKHRELLLEQRDLAPQVLVAPGFGRVVHRGGDCTERPDRSTGYKGGVPARGSAVPDVAIHVSGTGNLYMTEIAMSVAGAARSLGRGGEFLVDGLPGPDGRVHLVVAPHEYFPLHPLAGTAELRDAAASAVCVNVEQPGTPWFETAVEWARLGPCCLDINPVGTAALRARGVDAHRLQLGYVPDRDRWHGADGERDIDIAYLGDDTARRSDALGARANVLATRRCELRFFRSNRPVRPGRAGFLAVEQRTALLSRTRVLLNIHRGDAAYFEWVRLLDAMANGCVVVSEPSTDLAPLVPGVHLLEAPAAAVVSAADALLTDEPRRRRMAAAAHALLLDELSFDRLLGDALGRIAHHLPSAGPAVDPVPAPDPRGVMGPDERATRPLDDEPLPVTLLADHDAGARDLRRAMRGTPPPTVTSRTAAAARGAERVVVVLSRDDDGTIEATIEAALAVPGADVVVLDAGSTDRTISLVETMIDQRPWARLTLVSAWTSTRPVDVLPVLSRWTTDRVTIVTGNTVLSPSAPERMEATATGAGVGAATGIGLHAGCLVDLVPEADEHRERDHTPVVLLLGDGQPDEPTAFLHELVAEYR